MRLSFSYNERLVLCVAGDRGIYPSKLSRSPAFVKARQRLMREGYLVPDLRGNGIFLSEKGREIFATFPFRSPLLLP